MSNVVPRLVENTLSESFMRYSLTVIMNRALPDARDGLKPVHRRILYGMSKEGCWPGKPYIKSAKVVGQVIGSTHPHGDTAIYDAMVRMAQDFSLRYPLVDGQGNFGSISGDPAAAMRYTESRMAKSSEYMLQDLNNGTVDLRPNYDGTIMEPKVLPSAFPNLLANGGLGIAVGMASNMAPHNIGEVANAIKEYIDRKKVGSEITVEDLLPHLQGPDFPTGGIVCGVSGFKDAMRTGRGTVTVRSKYTIEASKTGKESIVFTEIPYLLNLESLIASIKEKIKGGQLEGISDLREESSKKDGTRIVVELKKGVMADVVVNQLFKFTRLQENFSYNNMAIHAGRPRLLNLLDMVSIYVDHREEVVRRRLTYEKNKISDRLHILQGLDIVQNNLDAVVKIVRDSDDQADAKDKLAKALSLTEVQADAVVAMRLGQLTKLDKNKIKNEISDIQARITEIDSILADLTKVLDIVLEDLAEVVRKVDDGRRTEIGPDVDGIDTEDLIPDDEMVVTISKDGYIKRVSLDTYRTQGRGGTGVNSANLKDEDYVTGIYQTTNLSFLMIFTNKGRAHWLKVWKIAEGTRTSKGRAIVTYVQLEDGEKIQAVVPIRSFDEDHFLMFATKQGKINKMSSSLFSKPRTSGINAIRIEEDDELVSVIYADDSANLMLASSLGQATSFAPSAFRPLGRGTVGVRGMTLEYPDVVTSFVHLKPGSRILTVTKNGYGKRTDPEEYRVTNRGGKGVRNISVTSKTGPVVFVATVQEAGDLIVTTKSGTIIRTPVNTISEQGRSAQGVKVISLKDDDEVMDATVVTE